MRLIDSVSKADVLETYAELYDVFDDYKGIKNELHKVYDKLNALPSAQPERKRARWINDKGLYRCSSCNLLWCEWWASVVSIERMNETMHFCPNCGADMRTADSASDDG